MTALHCTTEMYLLVPERVCEVWERKMQVMKLEAPQKWRVVFITPGLSKVGENLWNLPTLIRPSNCHADRICFLLIKKLSWVLVH